MAMVLFEDNDQGRHSRLLLLRYDSAARARRAVETPIGPADDAYREQQSNDS